jgi:hypothetical protein
MNRPTAHEPAYRLGAAGDLLALVASAPVPEPSEEQVEAYDAGRAAYEAEEPSTACPHDPRSELGTLWLRGYVLARRDDQYGPVR